MKTAPAKPTTIELPMKPRDKAEACPEVTRCQLEVIWDDGQGAIFIRDGPNDSKLVQIGLIGEKGCDARVRVGMIDAGGAIAIGAEVSGVGEDRGYTIWERRLAGCIDPDPFFLDATPMHLLSWRHELDNSRVSLIVSQTVKADYQVIVTRRGTLSAEPLRLDFASQNDNLYVSAAISPNLLYLFIAETRDAGGGNRAGHFYVYTFSTILSTWQLYRDGDIPSQNERPNTRNYVASRDGTISGQFSPVGEITSTTESTGGTCEWSGSGYSLHTERFTTTANNNGTYHTLTGEYAANNWWRLPQVYAKGELVPAMAAITQATYVLHNEGAHEHGETGYKWFRRTQESETPLSVYIAGDFLRYIHLSGNREHLYSRIDDRFTVIPPTGYEYHWEWSCSYTYFSGSDVVNITPGGWATYHAQGTTHTHLDPKSGSGDRAGDDTYDFYWTCNHEFNFSESLTNEKGVIYPVDLGAYYEILGSFTAVDDVTGDWYSGIKLRYVEDGPEQWHVYKNGGSIYGPLASCLGRPIDQLAAIYIRD